MSDRDWTGPPELRGSGPARPDPIEAELRELGRHLAVPPAPDASAVTAAVRARLESPAPAMQRQPRRRPNRWMPAVAWVAAALAVLFAGSLVVSPQVRAAVQDLLRFAGIEIHQGERPPVERPGSGYIPLPDERVVDLSEAVRSAEFRVFVPTELGEPDLVTVADSTAGDGPRVVSLLYFADGARSPAIRIDQLQGTIGPVFNKYLDGNAETVLVGGYGGLWIDGPHVLMYVSRNRGIGEELARLAGKTLIVEIGGTTLRIEGELTKERALEIAESLVAE